MAATEATASPLLSMRAISKAFGGIPALSAATLDVAAGEVHALIGQNGAGKSTMIKILTGYVARDAGEIVFDGGAFEASSPQDAQAKGISTIYHPVDIARMATAVSAMVRRALESFVEGKAELAQAVLEMDHVVDRMRDEAFIMLVRKMNEEPQVTQQALDALLVARNLERVADHATNISEDVIFWVLGADVRHHAQAVSAAPRPERREQ